MIEPVSTSSSKHQTAPIEKIALVLDTNIVLGQMDLLESTVPILYNCIVCDTVLRETASNNLSAKTRLVKLIKDPNRFYVAFANENSRTTYDSKRPGETDNDFNDRLIRRVARFFAAQLQPRVTVIFLSDDEDNLKRLAMEDSPGDSKNLRGMTMRALVDYIGAQFPEMSEKLAWRGAVSVTRSADQVVCAAFLLLLLLLCAFH